MMNLLKFLGIFGLMLSIISGCQTLNKSKQKVTSILHPSDKAPEIDKKGSVDVSKTTQEQMDKLAANMPIGQWVYIENEAQGIYKLQNKAQDGTLLFMRLNCKSTNQKQGFIIQNKDGLEVLRSSDEKAGQIQVLLDNKNYINPFEGHNAKRIEIFKTALMKAQVIKIYNATNLYIFKNAKAELLDKTVSCRD